MAVELLSPAALKVEQDAVRELQPAAHLVELGFLGRASGVGRAFPARPALEAALRPRGAVQQAQVVDLLENAESLRGAGRARASLHPRLQFAAPTTDLGQYIFRWKKISPWIPYSSTRLDFAAERLRFLGIALLPRAPYFSFSVRMSG